MHQIRHLVHPKLLACKTFIKECKEMESRELMSASSVRMHQIRHLVYPKLLSCKTLIKECKEMESRELMSALLLDFY